MTVLMGRANPCKVPFTRATNCPVDRATQCGPSNWSHRFSFNETLYQIDRTAFGLPVIRTTNRLYEWAFGQRKPMTFVILLIK